MTFSEKMYRVLLRAYPRAYRARYAQPMEQLFRDRLRDAHSVADFIGLWARTLADWAVSVPARYWERARSPARVAPLPEPVRRCLFFARSEASSFSRREITVEHLLLGILREDPSLVPGMSLEAVVDAIESSELSGRRVPPMEDLRLSRGALRVMAAASEIARTVGRREVAPADLAAAILRQPDTLAGRLLRDYRRR